jgi:hypothetical protein
MRTITTYRESGRLFILRDMEFIVNGEHPKTCSYTPSLGFSALPSKSSGFDGQYPSLTRPLRKSLSRWLKTMRHKPPTTIEAMNKTIPLLVVSRENQNVSAARPPMPFTIMVMARLSQLILDGVSGMSAGINETGVFRPVPQFVQKILPVSADAPHWAQTTIGVLIYDAIILAQAKPRLALGI